MVKGYGCKLTAVKWLRTAAPQSTDVTSDPEHWCQYVAASFD